MARNYAVRICGGDYHILDPRQSCPNALHDWPLPAGYVDAGEVAGARLRHRWSNRRCRRCSIYGWIPGPDRPESTNPVQVTMEATS